MGCGVDAPSPTFQVSCPRCSGYAGRQRCALCDGAGSVPRFRCASHEGAGLEAFMAAWSVLTQHGTWPVAGGLYAQSPWFVQAAQAADAEKGRLEGDEIARTRRGQGAPQAAPGSPQRPLTVQPAQAPGAPTQALPTRLSGPVRRP